MNRRVTFNVSAFDNGNELLFITGGEAGMSWAVTLSLGSVACPCERRKSISAKLFKLQSFTLQHEVRLRINKSLDMFETIRWDCSKGQTRLRLVIGADTHEKNRITMLRTIPSTLRPKEERWKRNECKFIRLMPKVTRDRVWGNVGENWSK